MKRTVLYAVTAVTAMTMVFAACKDKNSNNNSIEVEAKNVIDGNGYIVKVKAYVLNSDEYLLTSTDYVNNGFKMTLPEVPSECLISATLMFPKILVRDKNAKVLDVDFFAYDNEDWNVGDFYLEDPITDYEACYYYADRNFTVKGNAKGRKYDCTFKKGWNIVYERDVISTTKKPSGANFVWVYCGKFFRNNIIL